MHGSNTSDVELVVVVATNHGLSISWLLEDFKDL